MTVNLSELWDFNDPELSEERLRAALDGASPDDALILHTQIARTYGLRRDFARAQQILAEIESEVRAAGAEVQAHHALELGRTFSSATHSPETQTSEIIAQAREAYLRAFEVARGASLDRLAIDSLHMMAFIDTEPADQVRWNREAIALMEASSQADARKWEGSLRNNLGYALHQLGRFEEALAEFKKALEAHERGGNAGNIRVAHWMVAWTLRAMGRTNEALDIQLRLEKECEAAGEPDPYVFEELEQLYRALGDVERSAIYATRRKEIE